MRRVVLAIVVGLLGIARSSEAEPWTVTMEGGGEADSNVRRVESASGAMTDRVAAPVGRAGARLARRDRVLGGGYMLSLSGLARMMASSKAETETETMTELGTDKATQRVTENVMLLIADGRWLHAIGSRPVAAGIAVTAADALAIGAGIGARTFRNLGGDALLALGSGEDHHLVLTVGGRDFSYKPNHTFDWRGPVASARLDLVLWQPSGKTRSLELAATLGFEARGYSSNALANTCPPTNALPSFLCSAGTSLMRRDRYQRAGLELTWTGEIVATAGYQLTVIDSNSYGQSLIRHRIIASATTELIDKLFGTATATLQIDQYPDGVLVEKDFQRQEFANLEDENRSSLQVRIARELSSAWSVEARGAIWRDFGNPSAASFRRELFYAGVIYAH